MTLIELLVVFFILGMAISLAVVGLGAVGGSELRQSAGELSAAVRFTYNLAVINNKTYALYLDLTAGTYYAAPIPDDTGCERVLLAPDGKDDDPLIVRYGDVMSDEDKRKKKDDEEAGGLFDAGMGGAGGGDQEPQPPSWASDEGTASGRLWGMLGEQTRSLSVEESKNAGYDIDVKTEQKRLPTMRMNMLAKPKPLGKAVKFNGVVVREGQDPVTDGVVPILFFPHGVAQRALIYVKSGEEDELTIEILSLQGNGKIHGTRLDPSAFSEDSK
jgi:hypothetical protein